MNHLNTKKRGTARIIIFPFSKGFRAVCLDFDLIEDAETLEIAEQQIRESVDSYVDNIRKNNLSDELLNRHAEKKYWKILEEYQRYILSKKNRERVFPSSVSKSSFLSFPINSACPA